MKMKETKLRVIAGRSGSGKSFILADKVYEASKKGEVLVITDSPKHFFTRMGFVCGVEELESVTVIHTNDFTKIMEKLIERGKTFNRIFIDQEMHFIDNDERRILLGYVIGSGMDITVTQTTNMYGTTRRVTIYEQGYCETLSMVEEYSQKEVDAKISLWTGKK